VNEEVLDFISYIYISASLDSMTGTLRNYYTAQYLEPVYKVIVRCVCLKRFCIYF